MTAPCKYVLQDNSHLTVKGPNTVVISRGVQLAGKFTIRPGCRVVFEGMNIIHPGTEFLVEHPKGPVDWDGNPYR